MLTTSISPVVRRFVGEAARHALADLADAAAAPDDAALGSTDLSRNAAAAILAWFCTETLAVQRATLDGLCALDPAQARAIAAEATQARKTRRGGGGGGGGGTGMQRLLALEACAAIPDIARHATMRPGDGGVTRALDHQLPRNAPAMRRLLPRRPPALGRGAELAGGLVTTQLLGQGPFGEVWAAHAADGHEVAVKAFDVPEMVPAIAEQLAGDGLADRALSHGARGLLAPIAARPEHHPPLLTMALATEGNLHAFAAAFEGRPVPSSDVAVFLADTAAALAPAHARGVVHADLKPTNVLLRPDGGFTVTDLGVGARHAALWANEGLFGGALVACTDTAPYADPRRILKAPAPCDDVFALATIAAQLLLGDLVAPLPPDWPDRIAGTGAPDELISLLLAARGPLSDRPADAAALGERLGERPAPRAAPAALAPAAHAAPDVFRDALRGGSHGPAMVALPAGSFLMGAPENEEDAEKDERPQHTVALEAPFALGRDAVTFEEFDAFCAATDRARPEDCGWGRGRMPVINVSWQDAVDYCVWLSEESGAQYRLPSEAEWEYACRAGTTTPFAFGNTITTDRANYDGSKGYAGGPVGVYRGRNVAVDDLPGAVNDWGLRHMHGNIWEWTADAWHWTYEGAPTNGRPWIEAHGGGVERRVVRGGSWNGGPKFLRSANRHWIPPGHRFNLIGFRVARNL